MKPDEKDLKPTESKEIFDKTEEVLTKIDGMVKNQVKYHGEFDAHKGEVKTFMENATADLKKIDEIEVNKKRLEDLEKKVNRPVGSGSVDADERLIAERKAIDQFMRGDVDPETFKKSGLKASKNNEIEFKIMSVSDDPDAGYLTKQPTYMNELIKHITEFSPVRQHSRVIQSDAAVMAPKRTAVATASDRREAGSFTEETTRKYGLEIMNAHEISVRFDAYYWMLEDSAFNIDAEAQADAAEAFAVKEGTAFINGTAVGEAEGVMQNSDITARNQGEASTLTDPTAVIKLAYDINDQYTATGDAIYMMNRTTYGHLRTLQAGDGHFYMQTINEKGARVIEGYPVVFATDMDDIGTNAYPVIFGNFKKGYWILDRLSMWMLKDPYTYSDDGYVTFKFRRRVGGQVVQYLAFKKLKISA